MVQEKWSEKVKRQVSPTFFIVGLCMAPSWATVNKSGGIWHLGATTYFFPFHQSLSFLLTPLWRLSDSQGARIFIEPQCQLLLFFLERKKVKVSPWGWTLTWNLLAEIAEILGLKQMVNQTYHRRSIRVKQQLTDSSLTIFPSQRRPWFSCLLSSTIPVWRLGGKDAGVVCF